MATTKSHRPAPGKKPAARKRKPRRRIVRATVKITMFRCKRCQRGYNWPFSHVCKIGFTPAQARRAARIANANRKKK